MSCRRSSTDPDGLHAVILMCDGEIVERLDRTTADARWQSWLARMSDRDGKPPATALDLEGARADVLRATTTPTPHRVPLNLPSSTRCPA